MIIFVGKYFNMLDIYLHKILQIKFIPIFFICFLSACSEESKMLKVALESSGKNKGELEKVLQHYSDPNDSLKKRAAVFLIENMLHKKSFNNILFKDKIDFFKKIEFIWKDSTLTKSAKNEKFDSSYESMQLEDAISNLELHENLQIIKSNYLIENIELAFEAWKKFPWSEEVSFDNFCNYVLPYRVFDEPIGNWRKILMNRYEWVLDSIKNPTDMREATILINKSFNKSMDYFSHLRKIPNALGFEELDSLKIGKCDHLVIMNVYALRAMGIPTSAEGAIWANHRAGHTWCSIQEKEKLLFAFDPLYPPEVSDSLYLNGEFNQIPENSISKMKAAKVHRNTYKNYYKNIPSLSEDFSNAASISSTIGINLLDVTSEYDIPSARLNLKLVSGESDDILFLKIFNKDHWKKIVWSEKDHNGSYNFNNLGTGIVYLPTFLYDTITIPPFIFKEDGSLHYLKPNLNLLKPIKLKRKYFTRAYVNNALNKMVGGIFQGANRKDFSDVENLFEIRSTPEPRTNEYSFVSKNKYRYVRFFLPENLCRVAEMRFYGKSYLNNKKSNVELFGKLISSKFKKNSGPDRIWDSDVLTYFVADKKKGGWVGLDLGERNQTHINSVRFYPPSDGNSIEIGDLYELFYWCLGNWKSLGQKIAEAEELLFENCPDNALLILKNHSKGSDVRIFTYENDQQVWW
ncbi:hypothetical protein [Ulvibacterium marinum]|uniref:Transglutaminase domain-containing protein n=1 Tax=Ulvibacterium marinum TaxID=2419782 RepID=A0A3B0C1A3_9FLAO|nr:hypothetical protein [Ulvibacterium marinum]RKN77979.1 hypothetical protein D7Z94_22440 [Ulvibacterium marinum]